MKAGSLFHFDLSSSLTIGQVGSLPEWLRGQTRNLLGYARAGSNPAAVDDVPRKCETIAIIPMAQPSALQKCLYIKPFAIHYEFEVPAPRK